LLRNFESISSCRNRSRLLPLFLDLVKTSLGKRTKADLFFRSRDSRDEEYRRFGPETGDVSDTPWARLARRARREGIVSSAEAGGWHCGALALESSELWDEDPILVFGKNRPFEHRDIGALTLLAQIFRNHIRLLDYSELDSLTRLLNRKTFDETFDRLLTQADIPSDGFRHTERRSGEDASPAWLGAIDIDHFKRINDSFGHLFGDEVLLRVGALMRRTFRGSDRLFRFGGEEFVVILNAPDNCAAEAAFERFRASIEQQDFPQVGTVTCSVGYTEVPNNDIPVNVLGRADQALYFAKNNGRNRVCCYEQLLDRGMIVPISPAGIDVDIDALFH
jgi:diguanylate cyclase (GGDEF)-like protein